MKKRLTRFSEKTSSVYSPFQSGWILQSSVLIHFQICRKTLNSWHDQGLPRYKVGRIIFYKEAEINMLIEKNRKITAKKEVKKNANIT